MENTENMEIRENMKSLEEQDLVVNGGEPEDTEEEIARREEALKVAEEYYKIISGGDYYVRLLDKNMQAGTEPPTVVKWDSAKLEPVFNIKALQNSGNMSSLSWSSTGGVKNISLEAVGYWDRIGISCCKTGTGNTPYFVVSSSEHVLDSTDTHGNTNFKAVMIKADYQVIVPAYSEVELNVTVNLHVFKRGGETSSSWIGAFISGKDTWTPIVSGNGHWADNNGVINTNNPADCTFAEGCGKKENLRLSITDYLLARQENNTSGAELKTFTLYIVCNIEKSSTINQRLLIFDRIEDVFSSRISGEFEITYDPDGGEMIDTGTSQKISFDSRKPEAFYLYKAKKAGYRLAGWKDSVSYRVYPSGGLCREMRGMKLIAQWVPEIVECRVAHALENPDGTFPDIPTEYDVVKGSAGEEITPDVKCYEGYKSPDPEPAVISEDGSTIITYQYTRKKYWLRFVPNGGQFKGLYPNNIIETEVRYGDIIEYPQLESRLGYTFQSWSEHFQTMPPYDLTIKVIWEENN